MNLIEIFTRFPDHESCIEHLEALRFGNEPYCPHCGSVKVARKSDGHRQGRWNCHDCKSSFNVLSGTIFQKTKVPLQKWFLAISLVLNAKKSLSSHQLARDLDLNQKTAWFLTMRIREAMQDRSAELLQGILEADEAYIGGKPRKNNRRNDDTPNKRGRGTKKMPVIGIVERGGDVRAEMAEKVDGKTLSEFISRNADLGGSLLMTDEYKGYDAMNGKVRRVTIDHSVAYADGLTHTNTIEGFWATVKRAWFGSHHQYTRRHASAYITEACYKYNNRNHGNLFAAFLRGAVC